MNKDLIRNEMLYQMSIQPAKAMLENRLITKAEFKKMKAFLLEKYQPVIPSLLGL
ncbi:TPA: SHOCT domain-containing protein [Streptococcus suis]